MHKAWLAPVFGGVAAAVGLAAKTIADKKKQQRTVTESFDPEAAVDSIVKQMEADKDQIMELDFQKMEADRLDAESHLLYEHLPQGVVIENITNPCVSGNEVRVLAEDELREGELSALVYQVGCYSVRIADRVYREGKFESSDSEIPLEGKGVSKGEAIAAHSADISPLQGRFFRLATKEELEEYRIATRNPFKAMMNPPSEYQKVKEVTAAYMGSEYKNICQAMCSKYGRYFDELTFLGSIKRCRSVPDSQASLLVGRTYVGDSYNENYCYIFSPDGYLREYWVGGYNPDSQHEKWDWKG